MQYTVKARDEGELVCDGCESKEEFKMLDIRGVDCNGKIVVDASLSSFLSYVLAEKRGVASFILITDPPENLIRVSTITDDVPVHKGMIPTVSMSKKDGQYMLALMSSRRVWIHLESIRPYSYMQS